MTFEHLLRSTFIQIKIEQILKCKIKYISLSKTICTFKFKKKGAGWVDINTQQVFFTKNVKNYKKFKQPTIKT
jgi:hypothetical protein